MVGFRCQRCQARWWFPELTRQQAQVERRNYCPRCGHEGSTDHSYRLRDLIVLAAGSTILGGVLWQAVSLIS